jgi:hypothetical protein
MGKYLNTSPGPFVYNSDGQSIDGGAWFDTEETPQIKAAHIRGDLLKVDSEGNFIYDSIEESEDDANSFDGPLTPENAPKSSKKKLEG